MKKMRKLLPAIAMLLLSAVLMSTASFAWFSSNTTASVTGFNAKISAANTLLVKESTADDSTYATSINFSASALKMAPVSAAKVAEPGFYKVDQANGILPNNPAYTSDTTFVDASVNDYLAKSVTFRATGGDAAGDVLGKLHVDINASQVGGDKEINKSFRIMLVVDDTTVYYINPFGTTAVKPITEIDDETKKPTEADAAVTQDLTVDTLSDGLDVVAEFKSEETHKVEIWMWFEGQDPSCYANNATDLKNITVGFDFSLEEIVVTP